MKDSPETKIKLVCVLTLSNLLTSNDSGVEKRFHLINEFGIIPKLERILNKENGDRELNDYIATILNHVKNIQNK